MPVNPSGPNADAGTPGGEVEVGVAEAAVCDWDEHAWPPEIASGSRCGTCGLAYQDWTFDEPA